MKYKVLLNLLDLNPYFGKSDIETNGNLFWMFQRSVVQDR